MVRKISKQRVQPALTVIELHPPHKGQKFERLSDNKVFVLERQNPNGTLVFQGYKGYSFDPKYFKRV